MGAPRGDPGRPASRWHTQVRGAAIGLVATFAVLACEAGSFAGESNAPVSGTRLPAVTAPAADSLRLWLEVPERVGAGTVVPIRLRIENVSGRVLDLYLRGRSLTFDVVVTRAGGSLVWRRLEGEIIPAIVRIEVLGPGQRLEAHAQWDQRTSTGELAGPGAYTLTGQLLTDAAEHLETLPVSLRIAAN